jgi:hypothetical protein
VAAPLALAVALALGAADECTATDALGRAFRTCFDAGRGLELSAGAGASEGAGAGATGGSASAALAFRWRSDTFATTGRREWLRDMAFAEARVRLHGTADDAREAEGWLWRGLFLRRLAEPFLLVPGSPPVRIPFPFDVGMALDAGGARWVRGAPDRPETLEAIPLRGALLLDVSRHLSDAFRRAAFGPEVSYTVRREGGSPRTTQALAPFSVGRVELRAETRDGLTALALEGRAGALLRFPGTTAFAWEAAAAAERVLVAVNDVPLALFVEGTARGGALDPERSVRAGVRIGWFR